MQASRQKGTDQGRIISEVDEEQCFDTIQLKTLEESYREWVEASPRSDVRLSRKRILLIFLLIRYTGAKLNEILSLDPFHDIDFSQKLVALRSKKTKSGVISRKIPVPQSLSHEIQSTLSDPVFAESMNTKFAVDPGFVRRKFYERAKACGFDKRFGAPELIRKARAVELLQGNMPLPAVQNLLGHSTPNLTKSMVSFSKSEMHRLTQLFVEQESDRKTSARNSFFGKVVIIEHGDILTRIEMDTIDGLSVTSTITNNSLIQLGLKKGRLLTAEVKAPWVILQKIEVETLSCTAENQFKGVITRVNQGKVNTEYVVRISDVTELCSVVTTESFRQVGLKKGDRVWTLFNSFAVVLHAG
jgi:molybdate transport system regulatory protein